MSDWVARRPLSRRSCPPCWSRRSRGSRRSACAGGWPFRSGSPPQGRPNAWSACDCRRLPSGWLHSPTTTSIRFGLERRRAEVIIRLAARAPAIERLGAREHADAKARLGATARHRPMVRRRGGSRRLGRSRRHQRRGLPHPEPGRLRPRRRAARGRRAHARAPGALSRPARTRPAPARAVGDRGPRGTDRTCRRAPSRGSEELRSGRREPDRIARLDGKVGGGARFVADDGHPFPCVDQDAVSTGLYLAIGRDA